VNAVIAALWAAIGRQPGLVCVLGVGLTYSALASSWANAQVPFKVLAFYTGVNDRAHISFVGEANRWLPQTGKTEGFTYESTTDWTRLNESELSRQQVVVFLDTRPERPEQREAFRKYMEGGGAWIGFHFAGFALTPSSFPQDWDWYHQQFLGAGSYVSNTWRPTPATLKVDAADHPVTAGLPPTLVSAPNEWYRWQNDLRTNPDIRILLSIDASSFPLGTGPKPHEIWHSGYYPVVWTNTRYRMVYMNVGHNDIDYEHKTNRELSSTFSSPPQNALIVNALRWLGRRGR
jgi:uncharacterized protein